jgi:hypothetical protein
MKTQIAQVAKIKSGISETGFSLFGYDFNFYGLFICCLLGFFIFMMWRAQKSQKLDWIDIITAPRSNKVSLTKVLQLVGGVVGTWIVVQLTLQGEMTWEILAIYLAYVASIEGYSKFISAKYGAFGESRPQENSKSAAAASGTNASVGGQRLAAMQRPTGPISTEEQQMDLQVRLTSGGARADQTPAQ